MAGHDGPPTWWSSASVGVEAPAAVPWYAACTGCTGHPGCADALLTSPPRFVAPARISDSSPISDARHAPVTLARPRASRLPSSPRADEHSDASASSAMQPALLQAVHSLAQRPRTISDFHPKRRASIPAPAPAPFHRTRRPRPPPPTYNSRGPPSALRVALSGERARTRRPPGRRRD